MSSSEQAGAPPLQPQVDEPAPGRPEDRAGYLAFVAHEMRNPLSTALWTAELLTRLSPEDRSGPRGEKLANMCLRTLSRLRNLVEDHFLAERLAIGGLPVRLETVRLEETLGTATGRVPGLQLEPTSLEGFSLPADRSMLERALEALTCAAGRDATKVRVEAVRNGQMVDVVVTGAPPASDALRSPDRSTPSDPTGRALGLLMAAAIARAHGGALRATEEAFVLSLPAERAGEGR